MLSVETVSCLETVLRQFFSVLVLRVGVLILVSVSGWSLGLKNNTVSLTTRKQHRRLQFFSTTTKKEASTTELCTATCPSAPSPDATLTAYITAINQDYFNPHDRPNIYAEQKYLAIRQLITELFCIPDMARPPLWNVCFHKAVSSCGYIVQRWAMMYWKC